MTKSRIMTHEEASAAARKGDGVPVAVLSIHDSVLREVESRYLTEKYATVEDVRKALHQVVVSRGSLADPRSPASWVAVLPVEDVRRLIIQAVVVAHPRAQQSLPDKLIKAEGKLQQDRIAAASKVAFEVQKACEAGATLETVRDIIAKAPDSASAEQYLKSLRPGAPAVLLDSGALPDTSGKRLPTTLPSSQAHTLEVLVNSVNRIDGTVDVTIQRVVNASDIFREGRTYLVKCPSESFVRALLAAQLIDKEITIRVRGSLPIVADRGRPDVQLQHIEEGAEWVRRAITQLGQLQLDLV